MKILMSEDVKTWLAEEARKNMRSQTAEIVLAIKEKMQRQCATQKPEISA
ncbi:MAG: Arc domain-containing protein [Oxalobacteraceae bacterium]|nr:MAG: Arc domain-containing protein [Oxalobacteraceae bacterium]